MPAPRTFILPSIMTKFNLAGALSVLCLLLPFSTTAPAAVTTLRHFHFGDADPGSVPGGVATTSKDSATANPVTTMGSPLYTGEAANSFSDRSILFNGSTQGATTLGPDPLPADFGVEAWVKPAGPGGKRIIAYHGTPGVNGWGLILQANGEFAAEFGGQVIFGQGAVAPETWTHVAFVVTGGTATFYLNGVQAGPSVVATPTAPEAGAEISIAAASGLSDHFAGQIDILRVFTFATGAFAADDLLYTPPLKLALSFDSANVTGSWPLKLWLHRAESTTDLVSWTEVSAISSVGQNHTFSEPRAGQKFFRLKTTPNLAPLLPSGKFIVITSNGAPKNLVDLNAANANRMVGSQPSSLDARAFVDPADPNGSKLPLQFHWDVRYPSQPGIPYTAAGMTGYLSPVLRMEPATLATQPSPPNVNGRGYAITVKVHSPNSGLTSVLTFQAQVVGNALSISQYNDCQNETTACGTCPCTQAAALPATEPTQ
jgi:hypothetical protein